MAALITDDNGMPVTVGSGFSRFCMELTRKSVKGCRFCEACDRDGAIKALKSGKPYVYRCHTGLTDFSAPIVVDGTFLGSFIGGQVRTEPVDAELILKKAEDYDIDPEQYLLAAQMTNIVPQERIERAAQFLSELAAILSSLSVERKTLLETSRKNEESSRNRNAFLTKLSTDMHSGILGMMQMLSEVSAMDPKMKAEADTLLERITELQRMTDGTVEYMNIMDEEFRLHERIYNIRSVVELGLIPHHEEAKQKRTRLLSSFDESVPAQLYGDPARIERIISRLVQFCVHYTEGGEVTVSVYCRKQSYATMLMIAVSDNGSGMEQEELTRARECLAAENISMTEYEDFPMLEFSLMGHMVRIMSGSIGVESRSGQGTTFTIEIPELEVAG